MAQKPQPESDEGETASLPMSFLGDVKEGQTCTLKVVGVDEDSGTASVELVQDESEGDGSGYESPEAAMDKMG
jgi:hypothetical protein